MILIMGEVRFGAGEMDRLREDMQRMIAATREEDGCEAYAFAEDVAEPDLLRISERWRDEGAIDAHMQAPHTQAFLGRIGEARVEEMSIRLYRGEFLRNLLGD
ncbi:MAG: antibiotic biosynthesis monooxygenase [Pseudomonadota bacterium]|nr:antibiotic biosynthesis monooxygenase [Pseudomonadota bacterium]